MNKDSDKSTESINKVNMKWIIQYIIIILTFVAIGPAVFSSSWVSSSDFHASIEIWSSLIAILAGTTGIIYFFTMRNTFFLIVGLGFFICGSEDLVHGFLSYSRLWRDSGVEFSRFIPGTYVTGRLLLGLFTIVAVFFEKIVNDEHTRKQTARTVIPSSIFLGVVLTFIAFIIPLPQFIYPNQFISRPVDFLSGIVFLTALILVIKRMRVKGDVFSHFLILCLLLNIGGQVYMSFSKQLFDIFFDVAHVANILSYVMPVIGLTTLMQEFNQKLVISEEKYRGIFDESIAAIYLFDKNKNFIDTNQAGLDLLGYSREELLKLNIRDVDEDPETVKPAHQTLLAGDRIINYEHNLRRKDGQIVTVLNNSKPIFDSTGNIIGLQSTIVDITDRKRMEEKFRDIFESFVDVYYRMDKDNIVTIVSPSVSEYGYTPEDVVGTKGLDLYYDIDDREDLVGQLKRSGKVNDYEIRLKDARGNPVWISVNAELIYNQAGNYQGVQAVLRNIEDRKQAEESLKRSEAKYREIATSIPGVVYQFKRKKDGSFSFPYVNEKCELYFQQKAKDLEDDPNVFFDMVPKEELPPFIASIEKSAETMREWRHDFKLSLPDDQVRWFEGRSVPEELPTGDKLWNGVVIDVTERRLALQALQESEKKFRSVVEQSNDGIYVLQNERFVFINPRFTDITGYHLDEISGEDFNFKDIVAEEGLKVLEERDERRKRGEKVPERYTFKIIRKDQEKRDLEVSVSSFAWHGETATLGTVSDVTERLKTRLELEKALEKAQIGEKVKSLFLANISHEIRTPLNGIMGFMELIEGNTNALLSEKEQDYFNLMRLNCDRLKTTVHEILDISQIEAGAYKGQTGVHRLQDLVGPVIEKHQQAADEKKLNFTWQPWSETDDYVQCDEYAISKSISYLIDNAIKYTERGFVNIVESRRNGKIILRIEDSGIGMAPEYFERLFKPFSQESEGFTKRYQGIGLGLSIAKRHLDRNNVELHIESEKGKGTVVTLTFDTYAREAEAEEQPSVPGKAVASVTSHDKPCTLLVVEDDHSTQRLMQFILKKKYKLHFAISVKEGKRQLQSYDIDLVLLDLSLFGNESGLDLVSWMRKTDEWKDTPVIATTAHALQSDKDNCLAAGCDDYLAKPFSRDQLLNKIKQYFSQDVEA